MTATLTPSPSKPLWAYNMSNDYTAATDGMVINFVFIIVIVIIIMVILLCCCTVVARLHCCNIYVGKVKYARQPTDER